MNRHSLESIYNVQRLLVINITTLKASLQKVSPRDGVPLSILHLQHLSLFGTILLFDTKYVGAFLLILNLSLLNVHHVYKPDNVDEQ